MHPAETTENTTDKSRERAELEAVLASPLFARAPSLRRFLTYICEQHFENRDDELKEYSIAVEALGRPAGFDHTKDSIVRVEAYKLRRRLRQYYDEGEGVSHPLRIEIPGGQYAPRFTPQAAAPDSVPQQVAQNAESAAPNKRAAASIGSRRRLWGGVAALAVLGLVAIAAFVAPPDEANAISGTAAAGLEDAIHRIAVGSSTTPYVDPLGSTWTADRFFEGGEARQLPSSLLGGAPRDELYQSWREGTTFSYALPVAADETYELHLHFIEWRFGAGLPGTGESSRVFHVAANGERVLSELDILSDAGGEQKPLVRVIGGLRADDDGLLKLDFSTVSAQATLSGIEVFPQPGGRPRTVRILAGDRKTPIVDGHGAQWGADRYFSGGRTVPRAAAVSDTDDPNLYAGERYGNFHYRVPVPDATYTVRLHFAEGWFGADMPGGGGEGSRVFDVHCNGKLVLEDFDVHREAGGPGRAIVQTLTGVRRRSQGHIELAFVPKQNYAFINAIEVFAE